MSRYADNRSLGRSKIAPYHPDEEASDRHARRLQANLEARARLDAWLEEQGLTLTISNEGLAGGGGYFLPSVFEGTRDAPGWPTESDWPALIAHLEAHIASLSESDKRYPSGSLTRRAGGLLELRQRIYGGDRSWSLAFQISEVGRYQRGV